MEILSPALHAVKVGVVLMWVVEYNRPEENVAGMFSTGMNCQERYSSMKMNSAANFARYRNVSCDVQEASLHRTHRH